MFTRFDDWSSVTSCTLWVNKLNSVDELTAAVALVTLGIWEATALKGASTADHAISEGCGACFTVLLLDSVLIGVASILQVVEDILSNLSLLRGRSTAELIKIAIKPLVDLSVQAMIVIADLLASLALLTSLGLCSCAILVGTTDVERVVTG